MSEEKNGVIVDVLKHEDNSLKKVNYNVNKKERASLYLFLKRSVDIIGSFFGLLILSPLFLVIAICIKINDGGEVFYKHKRVGQFGKPIYLYKFRSMKMKTPDLPTHLLENPEQYITRVGKFIRKFSIDELPQIYDILFGKMSIIGPRPALWNQDDLIAERDKYGANDIKPGLTGWAQINGRDELPIDVKARFDGEYAQKLNAGGFAAFSMDCKCFFGTIMKVLKHDGVVEGHAQVEKEKEVVGK